MARATTKAGTQQTPSPCAKAGARQKKSRRQGGDGDGVDDDVFAVRLLGATRQSLKVCHVLESRHTVEFVDLQ